MTVVRPHTSSDDDRHHVAAAARPTSVPTVNVGSVLVVVALALGVLEVVWLGVVMNVGLAVIDPLVTGWWAAARARPSVLGAEIITVTGGPGPMSLVLGGTALVLSRRRRCVWPVAVGAGGLAALTVIDLGVKAIVARPRPPGAWHAVAAAGWSFPSGHAMFAAGALLLMVWMVRPRGRTRTVVGSAVVLVAFLVGTSRIVLGVHYPSDVIAGWCLAVVADGGVLLVVALVRHRAGRRPRGGGRADGG